MFRSRFLLSLAVVLCFCTLAAADSIPVSMTAAHTSAGILDGNVAVATHISTFSGNSTSAIFASINNNTPDNRTIQLARPVSGNAGYQALSTLPRYSRSDPFCCRLRNGPTSGHGMTTAEPCTLLLLSTGLIGLAGTARRKLRAVSL